MNRFSVGQEVVALTDPANAQSQPRIKGRIYTVLDILYCCKCGMQSINISGIIPYSVCISGITLCECGNKMQNNGLYWTASHYFAPLEEIDSLIAKAIEAEDYEMAAILIKPLNQ